jgi:hypothetical protein
MRHAKRILLGVLGVAPLALCSSAHAVVSDSYQSIINRNVFNLQAPKTNEAPPPTNTALPKIVPSGLTDITGVKQVIFKVQHPGQAPPSQHPGQPPASSREESFILSEGQRAGQIEVIHIDEKAGLIRFNNAGTVQTLSLERDGAKPPTTPAQPMPATGVASAGPGAVPPPQLPGSGVPSNSPPGLAQIPTTYPNMNTNLSAPRTPPTRSLRVPAQGSSYIAPGQTAPGTIQTGLPGQNQPGAPQPQLTPEEQMILMEVERERTKAAVQNGTAPPLPPTQLTPQ